MSRHTEGGPAVQALRFASLDWGDPQPVARDRILAGQPTTATRQVRQVNGTEVGLWCATPGVFATDHTGFEEFMQILEGDGELIDDEATTLPLLPGTTVYLPEGWTGAWHIRSTIVKSYTIIRS